MVPFPGAVSFFGAKQSPVAPWRTEPGREYPLPLADAIYGCYLVLFSLPSPTESCIHCARHTCIDPRTPLGLTTGNRTKPNYRVALKEGLFRPEHRHSAQA